MGSGRKELGILVTIWKGDGEFSTVSKSPELICWFACVIALSLRSNTKRRKCISRKRARIARRVGNVRTRWPRHRKNRRAAPFTAVRVGEASRPGPLSTKHLPCPHCPTWLSHSGTLTKQIQRFHTPRQLAPSFDLCEWNFSDADAVEECERRRRRGSRSSEAPQCRQDRRERKAIGPEEFTVLHSNVWEFSSRVAELGARLRLMKSKRSALCLPETWADKGLPTMCIEGCTLVSRYDRADGRQ